jgi:hypothetical protein
MAHTLTSGKANNLAATESGNKSVTSLPSLASAMSPVSRRPRLQDIMSMVSGNSETRRKTKRARQLITSSLNNLA